MCKLSYLLTFWFYSNTSKLRHQSCSVTATSSTDLKAIDDVISSTAVDVVNLNILVKFYDSAHFVMGDK